MAPRAGLVGDIEAMCRYAGTGVDKVIRTQPMCVVINEIMCGLAVASDR